MLVKLTCDSKVDIFRQTKGNQGIWGDYQFLLNQSVDVCDGWVVFDGLMQAEKTVCDPSKTVFIAGEPESVHSYNEQFLSQFAVVITPQKNISHPNIINQHPAYHWYAGIEFEDSGNKRTTRLSYDDFELMDEIPKTRGLSVICSTKTLTPNHRERLASLEVLAEHLGVSLEIFGSEHSYIKDKWEALAPYKYSIVLENSETDHYWTEKVADAFLASTYSFYWGCSNLEDYFPHQSFQRIDIKRPKEAARLISEAIKNDTYDNALPYLKQSRRLILERYNLFPTVANLMQNLPSSKPRPIVIKPEEHFAVSPIRRVARSVKHILKKTFVA